MESMVLSINHMASKTPPMCNKIYIPASYYQLPVSSSCLANIRECLSTSSDTPLIPSFSASNFISFPSSVNQSQNWWIKFGIGKTILNFKRTKLGSLDALGNIFVSIFMVCRAFGGSTERNNRAVLALGENGLKTVETSVMNRVIIFATGPYNKISISCQTKSFELTCKPVLHESSGGAIVVWMLN